jgi:hypothetical protein
MIVHFFTTAAASVMFAIGYHGYSISVVALRLHEFRCHIIVISTILDDLRRRNIHLKFYENLTVVVEFKHADVQTWLSLKMFISCAKNALYH